MKMSFFRSFSITAKLRLQLTRRLEAIAQADYIGDGDQGHSYTTERDISEWRLVQLPLDRVARAAFILGQINMEGFPETSIEKACYWFNIAAERGHLLSMTLVATFAQKFGLQGIAHKTLSWLYSAACHGSKPALRQLRQTDPTLHSEAVEKYRTTFWASLYSIPPDWIKHLTTSTSLDWLATRDLRVRLGDWDCSPLQCAAMVGSQPAVKYLLRAADAVGRKTVLDEQNSRGDTALIVACRSGHANIVHILLEAGANSRICNVDGENGLHWLAAMDDNDMFDAAWALLMNGAELHQHAKPDGIFISPMASTFFLHTTSGTPLHRAVDAQSLTAVSTLLQLGASSVIACDGRTPLCRAASLRRPDLVRVLLSETPPSHDINTLYEGSRTVLLSAMTFKGKLLDHYNSPELEIGEELAKVCSILLGAGAKVTGIPGRPVGSAVGSAEHATLDLLIQNEPESLHPPQPHGGQLVLPILQAVLLEDLRAVEILILAGASPFATVRFGTTGVKSALHFCLWHSNASIAKVLLSSGLDPDEAGDQEASDTPLSYALLSSSFELATSLIDSGATLSKLNPGGRRGNVLAELLYLIPDFGLVRSLEWLVAHPNIAIPLMTNHSTGLTVFHSICSHSPVRTRFLRRSDFQSVFNLLRRKFPDPKLLDLQDEGGYTALHYATATANLAAVESLLEAGANPLIRCFSVSFKRAAIPLPWIRSKSPLEIAQQDLFVDVPDGFHLSARDRAFWTAQRERIRIIFSSRHN